MPDAVLERVFDLVAKKTGVERERLDASTRLVKDLGCNGDDAAELLEAFSEQFKIDLQEFPFMDYFSSEAEFGFWHPLIGACVSVMALLGAIATSGWHRYLMLGLFALSLLSFWAGLGMRR